MLEEAQREPTALAPAGNPCVHCDPREVELQRLHLVTLTGPDGTVWQTTPPTDAKRRILDATHLAPPPRITTLQPA